MMNSMRVSSEARFFHVDASIDERITAVVRGCPPVVVDNS